VNFKNIDIYKQAGAPTFTMRAELVFKGVIFAISAGGVATAGGVAVS